MRTLKIGLIVVALLAALAPVVSGSTAQAAGPVSCSAAFLVDETLPSGARWQMCWEVKNREGVILHDVTYTPPGGDAVEVLGAMHLAQIHVPYDNNFARFHDLSDYGLGREGYLNDLQPADCSDGDLLPFVFPNNVQVNALCQQVRAGGYAYKDYDDQAQSSTLSLFSVSHIGAYNYVVAWNFDDDGTIRPEVGATGQLQMYGGNRGSGWNVGGGRYAVAHMHNFYWKLDFDLDGPANDQVQELAAPATPGSGGERLTNSRTTFRTEAARQVLPGSFRTWRVRDTSTRNSDGHPISYELLPNTDNVFHGPIYEPFTQNELYVTRRNSCERFASHNPMGGGACGSNLSQFANGESMAAADAVVWYGTSFHHLPRDEDEPHMDTHWSGFSIVPRDLTAEYPDPLP